MTLALLLFIAFYALAVPGLIHHHQKRTRP